MGKKSKRRSGGGSKRNAAATKSSRYGPVGVTSLSAWMDDDDANTSDYLVRVSFFATGNERILDVDMPVCNAGSSTVGFIDMSALTRGKGLQSLVGLAATAVVGRRSDARVCLVARPMNYHFPHYSTRSQGDTPIRIWSAEKVLLLKNYFSASYRFEVGFGLSVNTSTGCCQFFVDDFDKDRPSDFSRDEIVSVFDGAFKLRENPVLRPISFSDAFQHVAAAYQDACAVKSSDFAVDVLINALTAPLREIGNHNRLLVLQWWFVHIAAHERTEIIPGLSSLLSMPLQPFVNERSLSIIKRVSKDESNDPSTQVFALILRAAISSCQPMNLTICREVANVRRRARVLGSAVRISSIPDHNQFEIHNYSSPRTLFSKALHDSNRLLRGLEGPWNCPFVPEEFRHVYPTRDFFLGCPEASKYMATSGGSFCDACGKSVANSDCPVLKKCAHCRLAFYCNESCQAKAWKNGHKTHCRCHGRFNRGDCAFLHGLLGSPHLNGTFVVCGDVVEGGRVAVDYQAKGGLRKIAVKTKNLCHIRPLF